MDFMNSYKRLDNLCRDTNGIGVTGYIEDMERKPRGSDYVPGWKEDYLQLKHYRHIRNQIAHEIDADENNMCSHEDVTWVEGFYRRIMVQDDPLALYHQAVKPKSVSKKMSYRALQNTRVIPAGTSKSIHKPVRYAVLLLIIIVIVIIALLALIVLCML